MQSATRRKVKVIIIAVLALLGVIITLQNTAVTQTKLLFVKLEMPLAILIFAALGIGFATGIVAGGIVAGKNR